MFCCFNARCYTLLFVLCFIVGFGQSKKEQIAFLTHQKDSLLMALQIQKDVYSNDVNVLKNKNNSLEQQLELITTEKNKLIIQQNTNKAEIVKLQSTITSLDKKYDALLLQSKASYAMIAKLNRKIDSLSNVGFGTPLVESGRVSLTFINCIDENTIELPVNGFEGYNQMIDRVFPLGWNAEGVFMYNSYNEFSGGYYFSTEIIDLSKDINIKSFVYENVYEKGLLEKICSDMYINYNQSIIKYNITPISNLKMNFLQSKNGIIALNDMVFKIERSANKAQLVVIKNRQKQILKEQVLDSYYSNEFLTVCENNLLLNGCFLNPLNKNQIIFHMYFTTPCGFEGETSYSSNFASYILSD